MTLLLLLAPTLSLLILGAHFLRSGNPLLVGLCLGLIVLQGFRRRWVPLLLQSALLLGAIEWVRTLLLLRAARALAGEPATRMVLILAGVAAFTLLSALAFRSERLRHHYGDVR